ncbi:ANTAR domain-containing protein [Amycolatopsis sp. NPDC052450]|uniref:ANTAR domain-containing protein n=1 Tax=Amycolatopsis sp. NPDC052450 TaxID=3363937 RepID=UPI0037C52B21
MSSPDEPIGIRRQLDDVTTALEALIRSLEDDGALDTALQVISRQLLHVIPGADIVSVTLLKDGVPATAACTDQRALGIDTDQYRAGSGPCLEAAVKRQIVRVDVGSAHTRWPEFAGQAASAGVASFLSAPLAIDAEHTGSLNLYGFHVHAYREVDAILLELFVTAVEGAMRATARYRIAREEADQLATALLSRAVIDQAKGILMGVHGVSADEAFQLLVEQSQRKNVKLRDFAEQLVTAIVQAHH